MNRQKGLKLNLTYKLALKSLVLNRNVLEKSNNIIFN